MALEKTARDRILRVAYFLATWFSMAFLFLASVFIWRLMHGIIEQSDLELHFLCETPAQITFLCLFGVLVLGALAKEPFMASHRMSFVVNSLCLLTACFLFICSGLVFLLFLSTMGSFSMAG